MIFQTARPTAQRGAAMGEYAFLIAVVVFSGLTSVIVFGVGVKERFIASRIAIQNPAAVESSVGGFYFVPWAGRQSYADGYGYVTGSDITDPISGGWVVGTDSHDVLSGNGAIGVMGLEGDDIISGTTSSEIILPGPGNDIVNGRGGSDTVTYERGGGHDIYQIPSSGGSSLLDMSHFLADDSFMRRGSVTEDLIIELEGGSITLKNMFSAGTHLNFGFFKFADATYNAQEFRNIMVDRMKPSGSVWGTGLPEDHFHAAGDGSYKIWESARYQPARDNLRFPDLLAQDVSFRNVDPDLLITTPNGDVVNIAQQHRGSNTPGIGRTIFSDGQELNREQMWQRAVNDQIAMGAARIEGTSWGETFYHIRGIGSYIIADASSTTANDTLDFGELDVAQVTFIPSGNDLRIETADSDVITILGHTNDTARTMNTMVFRDTTLNISQINNKLKADERAAGRIEGDFRTADHFTFMRGESSVTIRDNGVYGNIFDSLTFPDIDRSELTFSWTGNNLVIGVPGGNTVTIRDQRAGWSGVESIHFRSGGNLLTKAEIVAYAG